MRSGVSERDQSEFHLTVERRSPRGSFPRLRGRSPQSNRTGRVGARAALEPPQASALHLYGLQLLQDRNIIGLEEFQSVGGRIMPTWIRQQYEPSACTQPTEIGLSGFALVAHVAGQDDLRVGLSQRGITRD